MRRMKREMLTAAPVVRLVHSCQQGRVVSTGHGLEMVVVVLVIHVALHTRTRERESTAVVISERGYHRTSVGITTNSTNRTSLVSFYQ